MNGHAFEALWSFSTALVARGTTVVRLINIGEGSTNRRAQRTAQTK